MEQNFSLRIWTFIITLKTTVLFIFHSIVHHNTESGCKRWSDLEYAVRTRHRDTVSPVTPLPTTPTPSTSTFLFDASSDSNGATTPVLNPVPDNPSSLWLKHTHTHNRAHYMFHYATLTPRKFLSAGDRINLKKLRLKMSTTGTIAMAHPTSSAHIGYSLPA